MQRHSVAARELDGADVQDLGPGRGELEHLLAGDAVELAGALDDAALEIRDPSPTPEGHVLAAAERTRLDGCLSQLDGERAAAVKGAYLDGHSYADLAERHGVPLNTMRTWLRRSLMRLKECLEP